MLNIILLVAAGIVLVVYIARRRARLRGEESDKK
jgi:hypothetical protein